MALNPLSPEWPKHTADLIDRVVQGIRAKFTTKAVTATNAIVFGLLAALVGLVAAVLVVISSLRAVQAYLTWELSSGTAWGVGIGALAGLLLVVVGLIWSKRPAVWFGAVLLAVAGARWALDAGDTGIDHDTAVWISYLVVGGLFVLLGAFLMAKRHSPASPAES